MALAYGEMLKPAINGNPLRMWLETRLLTDERIQLEDVPAYVQDLAAWEAERQKPFFQSKMTFDIHRLQAATLLEHREILHNDPVEIDRCAGIYEACRSYMDIFDVLHDGGNWLLAHIKTAEGARLAAEGSSWCTGRLKTEEWEEDYKDSYLWLLVSPQRRVQIHFWSEQVKNRFDQDVTVEQVEMMFAGSLEALERQSAGDASLKSACLQFLLSSETFRTDPAWGAVSKIQDCMAEARQAGNCAYYMLETALGYEDIRASLYASGAVERFIADAQQKKAWHGAYSILSYALAYEEFRALPYMAGAVERTVTGLQEAGMESVARRMLEAASQYEDIRIMIPQCASPPARPVFDRR